MVGIEQPMLNHNVTEPVRRTQPADLKASRKLLVDRFELSHAFLSRGRRSASGHKSRILVRNTTDMKARVSTEVGAIERHVKYDTKNRSCVIMPAGKRGLVS